MDYEYICEMCKEVYNTENVEQPICNDCCEKTGFSNALVHEMFGYPNPTQLQISDLGGVEKAKSFIRSESKKQYLLDRKEKLK